MPLPDRAHIPTEHRLAASRDLDARDTRAILELINDQDARVADAVRDATPAIADLVDALISVDRIIYLGAGTSGRLGVLDASECPPTFHCDPNDVIGIIAGGDGALRKSSEGAEDDPDGAAAELDRLSIGATDAVIGIAAGGTTPYVRGGITLARQRGAITAMIACADVETDADHRIVLDVGPEVVTGSTRMKAGTATKLALNMISTAVMVRRGKTWGNLMVDLRATNAKLRDRAARIICSQTDLSRSAALDLLDRAGGRVKRALVMAIKNVDAAEASHLLDQHTGRLRPLLGDPK